jgi:hypothetical protein
MNCKSVGLIVFAALALGSCKKEPQIKEEFQNQGAVSKQILAPEVTEQPTVVDPNAKMAVMHFSKLEHDFGTINPDDVVETTFTFTNNGEANLVISKAAGSCGCTVPDYPKEPIAPGQKATVKVSFNPKGKMGMQNKTVTLTTNTEAGFEKLTVKANIVK